MVNGLAAGYQLFYHKFYGFFLQCWMSAVLLPGIVKYFSLSVYLSVSAIGPLSASSENSTTAFEGHWRREVTINFLTGSSKRLDSKESKRKCCI